MQLRIFLSALLMTGFAFGQTTGTNPIPLLNTGLPNPYPTPPPLLHGVTSTDPLLGYAPAIGDPPASSSPCVDPPPTGTPPCILTVQYNNARQDANLYENLLTVSLVSGASPAKSQFLVDASALPPGYTINPVYAQPLYEAGLTIGSQTYNVLYVAALNGEVYAYNADYTSANATCHNGAGQSGCIWSRDEINTAQKGLKHNCDTSQGFGKSVAAPLPFLDFAGVISTPVIVAKGSAAAMWVTNFCEKPDGTQHWYLNALNISTGGTLSYTEITYSTNQIQPSPNGPQQPFNPAAQLQRSGLLLAYSDSQTYCTSPPCRSVIATFATSVNENMTQYQGWFFDFDGSSPSGLATQTPNSYTTQCYYSNPAETNNVPVPCNPLTDNDSDDVIANQCGQGGGVWMFARGPAANTTGGIFAAAGNGGFNYCPTCTHQCMPSGHALSGVTDFGNALLKIPMSAVWTYSGSGPVPFWPTDYFVPYGIPSYLTGYTDPGNCQNSSGQSAPCTYFQVMNDYDWDLGTSGAILFNDLYQPPTGSPTTTDMVLTSSKRGDGYVNLQSDLAQYQSPTDTVVARFNLAKTSTNILCTYSGQAQGMGECDEPATLAYWNPNNSSSMGGFLVAWPWREYPVSYRWTAAGGTGTQYSFNVAPSLAARSPAELPPGMSAARLRSPLTRPIHRARQSFGPASFPIMLPVRAALGGGAKAMCWPTSWTRHRGAHTAAL